MGEGTFLSAVSMTARIFSALADVETVFVSVHHINNFEILDQTSPNFQGSRRNGCECVCKITCKTVWELTEISTKNAPPTLSQRWLSALPLITFEVLNQTPLNLLGSCRSSSRWYLQNYIKNGWEFTSELTSKWIYILKYSSKFHTNLINNFWSTRWNSTEFTGQWPIIPFDGACKTTWKTVENWRLNWRLNK